MTEVEQFDVVCVGGGAVGLVTALELTRDGARVALVDRQTVGREASWAGAGIIPPAYEAFAGSPYDRLRAVSYQSFPRLAEEIAREVGIDIGFRTTGALEIFPDGSADVIVRTRRDRTLAGIEHRTTSAAELQAIEPSLAVPEADLLPGVCQIRNPRFLAGLRATLLQRGVSLFEFDEVMQVEWVRSAGGSRSASQLTLRTGQRIALGDLVVATGAWSGEVLQKLFDFDLPIYPVQGQILVLETPTCEHPLRHIILEGKRYLVPREDGLTLVGSTEEETGFSKRVTAEGLDGLREFAGRLVPSVAQAPSRFSWAGLRPANRLGHPVIGPWAHVDNVWLATGHFRHGLQQSPGTARLIADWIAGRKSFADPEDFHPSLPSERFESPFQS